MSKGPKKAPPLHEYSEGKVCSKVVAEYGIDSSRFNSIAWLDGDTYLLSSGKFVQFLDLSTGAIEWNLGPEDGGVGFVAVHPSRNCYVYGERARSSPAIKVFAYPTKTLSFELLDGASCGFSAGAFDTSGSRLATVATEPDYTLSIWDWETRSLLLRNKCFSADVTTVVFSRFDPLRLVTGGAGHIKFWQTASTFTGMKLQGTLGKFGRMEISDVTAFEVLPDGKVLSGSESGSILLWEGDLIKCIFVKSIEESQSSAMLEIPSFETVHQGRINVLELIYDGEIVVTAGDDGFLRFWERAELELVEGDGVLPLAEQPYLLELNTDTVCPIRSLTWKQSGAECVLFGTNGVIQSIRIPSLDEIREARNASKDSVTVEPSQRHLFNGGAFTCLDVFAEEHLAVVGGADGVLRVVDYVNGTELFCQSTMNTTEKSPVVFIKFLRVKGQRSTLVAGLENGVLLLYRKDTSSLKLLQQLKPHTDGMIAMATDPAEEYLCTLSNNQTVFFFKINGAEALAPLGFCTTPLADPLCIEWDEMEDGCLVGYKSGEILAVSLPKEGAVNPDVSFEYQCEYSLVAIRQRRIPPPTDEDDMYDLEEEILEEQDNGPWPVVGIRLVDPAKYVVAMGKEELVYTYTCTIRYRGVLSLPPLPPTGIEPPNYVEEPGDNFCYGDKLPVCLNTTLSPGVFTVVCSNAFALVQDINSPRDVSIIGQAHDSTYSAPITGVQLSFDGSMILSTGLDGLLVSQQVLGKELPVVPKQRIERPVSAVPVALQATDAVEAPILSIQEQKEKEDRERSEAEKQAIITRFLKEIDGLHNQFIEVLDKNNQLPPKVRLSHAELSLDDAIEEYLCSEKEQRVLEARKEFLVNSIREDVRTGKLKKRFMDNLLFDRVKLFSFSGEFYATSFRTANPMEAIQRLRAQIVELENSDGVESDGEASTEGPPSPTEAPTNVVPKEHGNHEIPALPTKGMNASLKQQLEKIDERRKERELRRKGYQEILEQKPDPRVDDHNLEVALREDLLNRGECVLRTDPNYVTSDKELKPTAKAKLLRLITLQEFVVSLKMDFNEKFMSLRDKKVSCIQQLNRFIQRINEIDAVLGEEAKSLSYYSLATEEEPEKIFQMSHEDLDQYSTRKQEEKLLAEESKKAQRGFGADLAGATAPAAGRDSSVATGQAARSTRRESSKRSNQHSFTDRGSRSSTIFATMNRDRLNAELKSKLDNVKLSEREMEEKAMTRAQLLSEKKELEKKCQAIKKDFDSQLFDLLYHRGVVDSDCSLSSLHLLLLFREYQLLLIYRSRDKDLKEQLSRFRQDGVVLENKQASLQLKISELEQTLNQVQEKKKELKHAAEGFISENFPSDKVNYILKVFNRKIKRKPLHAEDDDDDITSDDEDEIDEEDDIGEEICPASCSTDSWNAVLRLRNDRLDIQDEYTASKNELEKRLKELKDTTGKEMTENKEKIKKCQEKKKELDKEKRKVLNMLNMIVPLHCSQIKCLTKGFKSPVEFGNLDVTVISDGELSRLFSRLCELATIKINRRKQLEDSTEAMEEVRKQKGQVQNVHASWEAKVHEVMMLKFGQHVDLEMLEQCGTSRRIEAKKEELRQLELRWERELRKQEHLIDGLRDRLQNRLIENTHLLQDFGTYEGERQQLQKSLAHSTANATSKFASTRIATADDKENLKELITAQQDEIAALTAEIMMLKRKGGHAYSPSMY